MMSLSSRSLLLLRKCYSVRLLSSNQGCCQIKKPKPSSLADERPDLDFDYLLDKNNLSEIQTNIDSRKGIGNIQRVHELWNQIQNFKPSSGNQPQGMEVYQNLWNQFYSEALLIPNKSDPKVLIGDESKAKTIFEAPFIPNSAIKEYRTAEEIVKSWRSVLYPRRSAGGRSYSLIGPVANLQSALFSFVKDIVLQKGFIEVQVSDVLPKVITQACGLNVREEDGVHPIQYSLTDFPSMCLSGTAEMGVAQTLEGRTFDEAELPLFLVAESRCFRPEISKSASEAKLYRVHEFNKLEMFAICRPDQSSVALDEFVQIQKNIWNQLGVAYRVLDMPSEELGAPASRKFDLEAYMPGRKLFGEVSSASNCTDYQSRRLGIKFKDSNGNLSFVHTCNGTALASTRAMIAVLETFQTKQGFEPPTALQKYLPKDRSKQKLKISPV